MGTAEEEYLEPCWLGLGFQGKGCFINVPGGIWC